MKQINCVVCVPGKSRWGNSKAGGSGGGWHPDSASPAAQVLTLQTSTGGNWNSYSWKASATKIAHNKFDIGTYWVLNGHWLVTPLAPSHLLSRVYIKAGKGDLQRWPGNCTILYSGMKPFCDNFLMLCEDSNGKSDKGDWSKEKLPCLCRHHCTWD